VNWPTRPWVERNVVDKGRESSSNPGVTQQLDLDPEITGTIPERHLRVRRFKHQNSDGEVLLTISLWTRKSATLRVQMGCYSLQLMVGKVGRLTTLLIQYAAFHSPTPPMG
jgi:hypothetical protein